MKNRTKIVFIITAVLLVLIFAACDSLISPIKGRNNPNDTGSPTPAPVNLIGSWSNNQVLLSWNERIYEGDNYKLEGFIIVRKAGSAPTTIWDGTIAAVNGSDDKDFDELTDGGNNFPLGRRVYYSVFSFGGKWDNMSEDENLNWDGANGTISGTENYNFVGPVSTSMMVPLSLLAVDDNWVDNGDIWYDDSHDLELYSNGNSYTCISFDIGTSGGSSVESATLKLVTSSAQASTGGIEINLLTQGWESNTYANLNGGFDSSYDVFVMMTEIPNSSDEIFEVDITDIVSAWVSGTRTNHGLRLRSNDPTMDRSFYSIEGGNSPELHITYAD